MSRFGGAFLSGIAPIHDLGRRATLQGGSIENSLCYLLAPASVGAFLWECWRRRSIAKPISIPDFLQTIDRFAKPLVAEREAV